MPHDIYSYNLFETENLKEFHFVFTDGMYNDRNLFVWALSFSDAIKQAREKAMANRYPPPYRFKSCLES